jgi:hypothetical protein
METHNTDNRMDTQEWACNGEAQHSHQMGTHDGHARWTRTVGTHDGHTSDGHAMEKQIEHHTCAHLSTCWRVSEPQPVKVYTAFNIFYRAQLNLHSTTVSCLLHPGLQPPHTHSPQLPVTLPTSPSPKRTCASPTCFQN